MGGWGWTPLENFNLHNWRLNLLKKLITENMRETNLLRQTKVSPPHPRKNLLDPHRKTFLTQGDKIAYNLFILQGRSKQANVSNTMYQGGHASTLPCSLRRQKQHGAT